MKHPLNYNDGTYQLHEGTLKRLLKIIEQQENRQSPDVLFFGDSITEMMDIDHYFPNIETKVNCGISGFNAAGWLNFIDEGVLKYKPKKVVLMIGTNDLHEDLLNSPLEIARNVKRLCEMITYNLEETQIILVSTLPCVESIRSHTVTHLGIRSNEAIMKLNELYQRLIRFENGCYVDAYSHFFDENNQVIEDYFEDGLHLSTKGYKRFTEIIKEVL